MTTGRELQTRIANKAEEDSAFRDRLIADPKRTVEQELGVTMPSGFTLQVHEVTDMTTHVVLPPDSRLSKEDLELVAGAGWGDDSDDYCPWGDW